MTDNEHPGYEAVRKKLLERGYLHGPVERFVLRDLDGAHSGAVPLIFAAAKAGLIGGPILGGLLAIAAMLANRLVVGATDLGLLWVYFAALSTVGLFVLNTVVALPWMALAGRRGVRSGDAVFAAMIVALPTMGYLGLLWARRHSGRAVAEDLLFLVLALSVALLVAWLAGMVSLAGIIGRTGQVPDRRRRTVLLVLLVLLPLGLLLVVSRGVLAQPSPLRPSAFDVLPGERRVLLVGVDGFDADLVQAFEPRGVVTGLLTAMKRGAVFPLRRAPGAEPAAVWTTLLTGIPADEHGVGGAGSERLPGISAPLNPESGPIPLEAALRFLLPTETVPTSGNQRRVRTLWEIVSLRQVASSIGWWASWPALADQDALASGYVVSDRVLPKLLAGAEGDRDTLPASLFGRIAADFDADRDALREEFEGLFGESHPPRLDRWLWESFLIDGHALRWSERLMADPEVRVGFVYLPGLDILRQRLASRGDGDALSGLLSTQAGLEAYVAWLDLIIGRLSAGEPGHDFVLIADPGRRAEPDSEGFVVIVAEAVAPGCVANPGSSLDVTPLVLRLLGFPASREMPGVPSEFCWAADFPAPVAIATFGRKAPRRDAPASDFDDGMVERLKSLGYLN